MVLPCKFLKTYISFNFTLLHFTFLHFYIVPFLFFQIARFLHFWKEVCKCGVDWWWSLTSITGTIFPIGHNLPDSSVRLHFTIQPPSINNLTIPTIHLDLHPSILSPFSAVHFLCCPEYIIRFYSELVLTINIQ